MPKISKSLLLTILLVLSLLVVGVLSYNSINSPKTSIIEQKPTSSQSSVATSSSSKNQLAISASSITTNTSGYSSVVSGSSVSSISSSLTQDMADLLTSTQSSSKLTTELQPTPTIDNGENPTQDIPNLTKLSTDKSIYHQYIKDYLNCPTKFYQILNGGYLYEGESEYRYTCIPQQEIDKCKDSQGVLTYGRKDLIGLRLETVDQYQKKIYGENAIYKENQFYCGQYSEGLSSISFPEGYRNWVQSEKALSLSSFFIIPKTKLTKNYKPIDDRFIAIPISSFSLEDQYYISENFKVK